MAVFSVKNRVNNEFLKILYCEFFVNFCIFVTMCDKNAKLSLIVFQSDKIVT